MTRPLRILLPIVLLALGGCVSDPFNPYGDQPEELVMTTRAFEDTVRWGALQKMVVFLKQEDGVVHELQPGLENVRVTDYQIANPLTRIDDGRWRQTAVIDYVLTDRQVVRQLVDNQLWVRDGDSDSKSWYRENPVPVFQ